MDYKEIKQIMDEIEKKIIEDFRLADAFLQGVFARRKCDHEEISNQFKLYVKKKKSGVKKLGVLNQK